MFATHSRLAIDNQIQNETLGPAPEAADSAFHVKFSGLRGNGYEANFPGRGSFVFQHLTSHFLPTFIGNRCPQIKVIVGDEIRYYPADIDKIVHRREPPIAIETEAYGVLHLTMMECDKSASADLKGSHFIHFIAHDRTV